MKLSTLSVLLVSFLLLSTAQAHIVVTPAGRMGSSDAVKFIQNNRTNPTVADNPGPCANYRTRMASPLTLSPGQQMTVTVKETINHPGRFYVQFSQANDAGFWDAANQLAKVEDTKNNGTTTITFNVPNVNCNTCTVRVLQEMDEQPGEYYVHCIDTNIGTVAKASATPVNDPGGTVKKSSALAENQKPGFGGCGTIRDGGNGPSGPGNAAVHLLLMMLPLFAALRLVLQRRAVTAHLNRRKRF